MGLLADLIALALVRSALGASIRAFGGEDPLGDAPGPENWHHEGLTKQAAAPAGWSANAQNAVAFHADWTPTCTTRCGGSTSATEEDRIG